MHMPTRLTMSSPRARVLDLLQGLKRPGNTDGVTCCECYLNARVSLAWAALWQLPFSGMTSFERVLDLIMPRRFCFYVGTLSPACLVLRPCVVARPTYRILFCPGALACA